MSADEVSLLPLLVTGGLAEHAVACNGCGVLVLKNPNAMNAHRDWHRMTAAPTGPDWLGTVLESCIRDVAVGRIASHSNVTDEMVNEWRRLNPDRAAPTGPEPRTDAAVGK